MLKFFLLLFGSFLIVGASDWHSWKSSDAALACENGGFPLDNTQIPCNCSNFWTEAYCSVIECMNGGFNDTDSSCACPPGYKGIHCETVLESSSPSTFFPSPIKSFNLYVNAYVTSSYYSNNTYERFMRSVLNDQTINSDYYAQFIYMSNSKNLPPNSVFGNKDDFISAVQNDLNKPRDPNLYSCTGYATDAPNIYEDLNNIIEQQRLSKTSINVFTQFPASDVANFKQLEERAIAFGVSINFYFADEPYLVGCDFSSANELINKMRELAYITGGIFVVYQSDSSSDTIPPLLSLQSNQQSLAYALMDDCTSSISVPLANGDPDALGNTNLIVAVRAPKNVILDSETNCKNIFVSGVYYSSKDELAIYSLKKFFPDPSPCQLSLPASPNNLCSIQLFASPKYPITVNTAPTNLRVYATFTYTQNIDSSYIGLFEDAPLYARIHIESDNPSMNSFNVTSITLSNENEANTSSGVSYKPGSTFEYISNDRLVCNFGVGGKQSNVHWLTIELQSTGNTSFKFTRSIPVKCYPRSPDYIPPPSPEWDDSSTTEEVTTKSYAGSTITEEIVSSTALSCPTKDRTSQSSFVADVSSYYSSGDIARHNFQYAILYINATPSDDSYYKNYAFGLFDINQASGDCVGSESLIWADTFDAYHDGGPATNQTNCTARTDQRSDIAQVLVEFVYTDNNLQDGSTMNFLISGKEVFDETVNNYTEKAIRIAAVRRLKLNFFMDASIYDKSKPYSFYRKAAALTDGHFIVMDMSNIGTIVEVLNNLEFKGYGQRLVLSSTFTGQMHEIGDIDLTGQSGSVTLYYTISSTNANPDHLFTASSYYWIVLQNGSFDGWYPGPKNGYNYSTNLMFESLQLEAGSVYTLKLGTNPGFGIDGPILVRVWQEEDPTSAINFNLEYLDSSTINYAKTDNGPSDTIGATAKITLKDFPPSNYSTVTVEFYDCNGVKVQALDNYDDTTREDGECSTSFYANPFFCNSDQTACSYADGAASYSMSVKISTSTGVRQYHANFLCPNDVILKDSDCTNGGTVSDNKCKCEYDHETYWRGALCQVPDCSQNGHLFYNNTDSKYECTCFGRVNGPSCLQGSCSTKNTEGGAIDNYYRTLTIAAVFNSDTERTAVAEAILKSLKDTSDKLYSFDKIWQYQLLVGLSDGYLQSVYFGHSLQDLVEIGIANLRSNNYSTHYNATSKINFTPVVDFGLRSIGNEIRGLFWVVSGNSGGIYVDDPVDNTVSDFYQVVQGYYKQEIYTTSVRNNTTVTDVSDALWATGGQKFDFDNYEADYNSTWLSELLNSQTSINFYETGTGGTGGIGPDLIYLASRSLLFYSSLDKNIKSSLTVTGTNVPLLSQSNGYIVLQADTANGYKIKIDPALTRPYYLSIRALDDDAYTPTYSFVDMLDQDFPEAMPIVGGTANVVLNVIGTPGGNLSITDDASNAQPPNRQSMRDDCTFAYSSVMQNSVKPGLNRYDFTITDTKTGGDKVTVNKVIPFSAAPTINCKNGGTQVQGRGKCQCPSTETDIFDGADCGRPVCVHGRLNSMRNACYCDDINYYGVSCNNPKLLTGYEYSPNVLTYKEKEHRCLHLEL